MVHPFISTLDIETADTNPTALIFSIGACFGNVLTDEPYETFYRTIKMYQRDRTTCPNTLAFWNKLKDTHPEAHSHIFDVEHQQYAISLHDALNEYNEWLLAKFGNYKPIVFGNGSDFDNVIVAHAMKQLNIQPQWSFRDNQSVRTINWIERLVLDSDTTKTTPCPVNYDHIAVNDATVEFFYVRSVVQQLIKKVKGGVL